MSDGHEEDYEVGYGKPPRASQFPPGQSGNPPGRPPRKKKAKPSFPVLDPTHKFIVQEAKRMVNVREGNQTQAIPATQAVMRALGVKAMQGGVLAMRTYLEYQIRFDAIEHAERRENFDFWREHVRETRAHFASAATRGEPEPEIYPHPDDVNLDYETLSVRIVGPNDRKEAQLCARWQRQLNLYYELIAFFGEAEQGMPTDERPIFGGFTFLFTIVAGQLPPRLRKISEEHQSDVLMRAVWPYTRRVKYLQAQLIELGFDIELRKVKPKFIDLRDLNLRFVDGGFEEYRWPKHKRVSRAST